MSRQTCGLYLMRHAQTLSNRQRRIQGQSFSALSKEGVVLLDEAATAMKQIEFNAIYSSDLARALKTAHTIASQHGMSVITSKHLRERKFGKYEGGGWNKLEKDLDEIGSVNSPIAQLKKVHALGREVESDQHIQQRVMPWLKKKVRKHTGQAILIVSHGQLLKIMLQKLVDASVYDTASMTIANLDCFVLDVDPISMRASSFHHTNFVGSMS